MNAITYPQYALPVDAPEYLPETPDDAMRLAPMRTLLFLFVGSIAMAATIAADQPVVQHIVNTDTGHAVDVIPINIMTDSQLRLYCIVGAMLGAGISLGLFKVATVREMASKLVVASFSGVAFTPLFMHWWNTPLSLDYVVGYSAAIALCSWSILQAIVPLVATVATKWFTSKTNPS